MKYLLIKSTDDWADEFDICSCRAIAVNEANEKIFYDALDDLRTRKTDDVNFFFGTNEETAYENGEQFYNTIKVKEISKEEYETLRKLGLDNFGNFDVEYQITEDYLERNDLYFDDCGEED